MDSLCSNEHIGCLVSLLTQPHMINNSCYVKIESVKITEHVPFFFRNNKRKVRCNGSAGSRIVEGYSKTKQGKSQAGKI